MSLLWPSTIRGIQRGEPTKRCAYPAKLVPAFGDEDVVFRPADACPAIDTHTGRESAAVEAKSATCVPEPTRCGPESGNVAPDSTASGASWTEVYRNRPRAFESGPATAGLGPLSAESGRVRPISAKVGPESAKCLPSSLHWHRLNPATFKPESIRIGPSGWTSAKFWPGGTKLPQNAH